MAFFEPFLTRLVPSLSEGTLVCDKKYPAMLLKEQKACSKILTHGSWNAPLVSISLYFLAQIVRTLLLSIMSENVQPVKKEKVRLSCVLSTSSVYVLKHFKNSLEADVGEAIFELTSIIFRHKVIVVEMCRM